MLNGCAVFVEDICYSEKSVRFDTKYQPTGILMSVPHAVSKEPFDCEIILMPPKNYSIVLSIYRYDIYSDDLLTIEDSDRYMISLIGWGMFRDERKSIISDGKMTIRYKRVIGSNAYHRQGFQFTYTMVTNAPCYDNEFKCKNGKCILKEYVCDGHNHCGDKSDQKKCTLDDDRPIVTNGKKINLGSYERARLGIIWITIISIVGVILFIVLFVFIVIVARHSKRNKAKTDAVSPNADNPTTCGNLPLQSVSSTVPQEAPTVPSAPPAPEYEGFYNRIRRSLRGLKSSKVEEEPKQERSEVYQVPSMYPSLDPAVSEQEGIENPEFKIEE
ncbi:uncharacterized protein TNCV_3490751 [Trichonephila clavipes]|nr:uncharacterized protein TNCV_3490751 [Trichonephila clavipes]